ncbi:hypothetical protein FB451DRAFT_1368734 [Mycena latifolia]|nr:hypothetical protein FB451DRAFT_1368734 [Mycena latifolia]
MTTSSYSIDPTKVVSKAEFDAKVAAAYQNTPRVETPAEDVQILANLLGLSPETLAGSGAGFRKGGEACGHCGRAFSILDIVETGLQAHSKEFLVNVITGKYGTKSLPPTRYDVVLYVCEVDPLFRTVHFQAAGMTTGKSRSDMGSRTPDCLKNVGTSHRSKRGRVPYTMAFVICIWIQLFLTVRRSLRLDAKSLDSTGRMSLHVGPRCKCAISGCDCSAFLSENSDGSPRYTIHHYIFDITIHLFSQPPEDFVNAEIECSACGHIWIAHEQDPNSVSPTNRRFIKGGADNGRSGRCGGFHSMRLSGICVVLSASPRNITPPIPASTTGSLISPQRPAMAFAGVPRARFATATAVQQQRQESIYRTLPQYQSVGGSSSAGITSRPSKRLSGPPRPYSATSAATLADFSAPSATSEPAQVRITVGILPKVLDTSDHNDTLDLSPRYTWKSAHEIEAVQRRLQFANLTFNVDVDTDPSAPIFHAINTCFLDCSTQNIDFVAPVPASINGVVYTTPNNMGWGLLGPKGRSNNRTWVDDPKFLTAYTFTLSALRGSPYNNTPNYLAAGLFIFIVPRLRNLWGPIDCLFEPASRRPDHVLTHKCFARRVLHPILGSLNDDPSPVCGSLCTRDYSAGPVDLSRTAPSPVNEYIDLTRPLRDIASEDSDDDVQFPEAEQLISQLIAEGLPPLNENPVASTQPMQQIVTRANHRRSWMENNGTQISSAEPSIPPFIVGPLLFSLMDCAPVSVKPRSPFQGGPIDLTLRALPGAGPFSLAAWQDHLAEIHGPDSSDILSIKAPTVDSAARALITCCIFLQVVRQPPAVRLKEVLQEQFPAPRPTVLGPFTEIALLAVRVQVSPGFGKGPRAEVLTRAMDIILSDGMYWTDCGEYKTLRLHPSLSPIPRRFAFIRAAGLLMLLHMLHIGPLIGVSPFLFLNLFNGRQTASRFDVDLLTRFISHDSLAFVKRFHSTALKDRFYASQDETCVEYQFLVNIPGVDPSLISRSRSQDEQDGVCGSIISFITLGSIDIQHHPDFLAFADGFNVALEPFAAYDQVHHILEWFETPCRELIISSYDRCIKSVSDVVSHVTFTQSNPETDPWDENTETVTVMHDWDEAYPCTGPDGVEDFGPEAKASFQSCFKTVSITNNARLRHMLLSDSPMEGQDTQFGQWFHGQALSSRESYTSV